LDLKTQLSEAELAVMEILWREGPKRAGQVKEIAGAEHGWERNTVYTLINRLINKGAVRRDDPNFVCTPLIPKDEIRKVETHKLLDKMYDGSINLFMSSFLKEGNISEKEFEELKRLIESHR
jgi:BlaI family penicillinase repressor